MDTELIKALNGVLKEFPQFWDGEKLHRSMVVDAINQKEPNLIKALISNNKIKSLYSTEIDDVLLFDFEKLTSLLKYKEFWNDSFTKYRNMVGLTSEGKYLNYNSDVVLDFPFKDCVLEGGMTKEDQGKDEIYYNEVIARDEIDRLFAPKVLTKTKRYTKDGIEENITDFSDEDNLIIKGNNLIALHSLKERYAGKVKLIYIDPPYNTGNDSFKYNDRFNRSTWLTFMKNRLEVARDLLSDDGSIWITLDDIEISYLKVLADSIFGESCFLNMIAWQHSDNSNNNALTFSEDFNHILVYSKKADWKPIFLNDLEKRTHFKNPDNDPRGPWFDGNPINNPGLRTNLQFDITAPNGNIIKHPANGWRWSKATMDEKFATGELRFSDDQTRVIRRTYLNDMEGLPPSNLWTCLEKTGHTRKAKYELKKLFPDIPVTSLFSTPKPELLINHIINLATNDTNDLVLDFFIGSGTTAAVAHKMGRRYIGIEQMDYINEITVPRLQKVIEGEQGGISKNVEWQGGGSFVYVEMMELNYQFIHKIENANDYEALTAIFEEMKNNAHLNYQADLNKVLKASYEMDGMPRLVGFDELELHEQKKLLIELLDKNQLYVSYSEIKDRTLNVSETDQAFNHSFYEKD
ncbi:site-specific DNA-methyltransferase [Wohlfahrtiimonas sp. G9077]|uniref:DNA methyltransferase n=1 Tax=Wohlfahrtiimonas sp. G9077 TaxID=1980118 RepID=UPI000B993D2B|nr:site-specific DNA-methyltransferase [Wohlfahrtiimonas sp. G9077]OYQ75512.1 cytosine methyltransferase [Wohlfahrtiimonas sp. G9077]